MRRIDGIDVLDTLDELVAPSHTALVCVDVQNDFCHAQGHFARHGKDMALTEARLPAMRSLVGGAQKAGVPVAFIRQTTLSGNRSDSPAWLRFKTRDGKSATYTEPGTWGWAFVDGLNPGPRDWVVEKFRPDAFHQTHLDLVLRAAGVKTLVVLGVTTEGCVESTVRAGSYHDYYVVVAEDAVAGPNAALHEGSMALMRQRYPMAPAEEIVARWAAAGRDTRAA